MQSTQIAVRLSPKLLAAVDRQVVSKGRVRSRAEAVRLGLELLLRLEREREIADEYAAGYRKAPQEEWIGELGLSLGAGVLKSEAGS